MKASPIEYWIWLQAALGAGARTDELLAYFETPEELYNAGEQEWRLSGLLTLKKIEALKNTKLSQINDIINECRIKGYEIITPDSSLYPKRLCNIDAMPVVLYSLGDSSALSDAVSIGIVGTRNASDYGIKIAQKLSFRLAESGATIVSGGALGIDSEAHAGAMLARGRTVAFLGCGLSCDYLRENAALRRAITKYGAVVSEYPPFSPPSKSSFPIRNRLISGISLGVVVIEAGVKSGSLITANKALDQGKDVFAVPGDILKTSFEGANHLINNGAKPVFSALDILCEYESEYADLIDFRKAAEPLTKIEYVDFRNYKKQQASAHNKATIITQTKDNLKSKQTKIIIADEKSVNTQFALVLDDASDEAKAVFSVLTHEGIHIDDIVRTTNLKMNVVLSSLTELELMGVCELIEGKKYILR